MSSLSSRREHLSFIVDNAAPTVPSNPQTPRNTMPITTSCLTSQLITRFRGSSCQNPEDLARKCPVVAMETEVACRSS